MVENSLSKAGLEVYVTEPVEDSNVTAIGNVNMMGTPNMIAVTGGKGSSGFTFDNPSGTETGEEETTTTTSASNGDDFSKNFVLQNGTILSIDYIGELFSDNYEIDYKDISSNSTVSVPIDYWKLFFKGKKCCLKKGWGVTDWEKMDTAILGFVTGLTWNKEKIDIKISGMEQLLEAEADLEFTQTKRSEVVKAIIEAAGLKAKVDVTGLIDDVIDFSTKSSSGSDEEGSGDSTGSASIDEEVEKAIKGKKDPLEKAKAIDKAFKNHVFYSYYWDVHHPNLDEAWKNAHLNCADGANVLCAMFIKGGLNAVILHVPDHYIVKVTIKGKAYFTDNAASDGAHTTRPFGEVWRGNTSGSVVGTKIPG